MRILSFHPVGTELVFSLGAGHLLVGRTEGCTYPEAASRVPSLGKEIGMETVSILEPDVILLGPSQTYGGAMETLRIDPRSIEDVYAIIKKVGHAVEKEVEADLLIHELESVLERVQIKCAKFHLVKVHVEGPAYLAELVRIAGGEPHMGDGVEEFDPQYVVVMGGDAVIAEFCDAHKNLNAVKSERIHAIPEESLRPTPRLLLGAKQLAKILHGVEVNGN